MADPKQFPDYTEQNGRDPAIAFRFYVKIDGIEVGQFLECGGLTMEREIKQYAEGGTNDFVHVRTGRIKWSNIVLKRGITRSDALWNWFQEGVHTGKVVRKKVTIVLGDAEKHVVRQWNVDAAFPAKWTGATLNTKTMEVAVETLELAHQGISTDAERVGKDL